MLLSEYPILAQILGAISASLLVISIGWFIVRTISPFTEHDVLAQIIIVFIALFPVILVAGIDYFSIRLAEKRGTLLMSLLVAVSVFVFLLIAGHNLHTAGYESSRLIVVWLVTSVAALYTYRLGKHKMQHNAFLDTYQVSSLWGLREDEEIHDGEPYHSLYDTSIEYDNFKTFVAEVEESSVAAATMQKEEMAAKIDTVVTPKDIFDYYIKRT